MDDGKGSTYPAVGDTQARMKKINGIWYTWIKHPDIKGKKHAHNSKEEANDAYDAIIEMFKDTGVT